MKTITFEIALTANEFFHKTITNKDKTPARCRRNGKTQTWKRSPGKFKIPVKYGLYTYLYITNENANEFFVTTN